MKNLCNLIVEKRREHGFTQAELGAMLGISGKAVSKWERGLSKPCNEHLEKLIELIGLPVELNVMAEEKSSLPKDTFLHVVRNELFRIIATGVVLALCVCNSLGMLSTASTVVSIGFSIVLFCFGTMIKG